MIRPSVSPIAVSLRPLGWFALIASVVAFADAADPEFSDGRIVAGVEWKCTTPEVFRAAQLEPAIADALDRVREEYGFLWGDRAYGVDLNSNGTQEYFVPLGCSGTGHCGWVVVGGSPPAVIAEIPGVRTVYVHEPNAKRGWSVLTGVWREGAETGGVVQYAWDDTRGAYVQSFSQSMSGIAYEAFLEGIGDPDCRVRRSHPEPVATKP